MSQEPTEFQNRGKLRHGLLILFPLVTLLAFKIIGDLGDSLTVSTVILYLLLLGAIPAWALGLSTLTGVLASRIFVRIVSLQKALVYTTLSMTATGLITAGITVWFVPVDHEVSFRPMMGKYSFGSAFSGVFGI